MKTILYANHFWIILVGAGTSFAVNPLISPMKVSIPISWEVMKSGFSSTTTASESESFVENWIYTQNTIDGSYLQSPRARVPVYGTGRAKNLGGLPKTLIVEKSDLMTLLGIDDPKEQSDGMPVFLDLSPESDELSEITIHSAADELISVAISLWR